jgi:hypothetical protein
MLDQLDGTGLIVVSGKRKPPSYRQTNLPA